MCKRIFLFFAWSIVLVSPGFVGAAENPWLERRVLDLAHRGGRAESPEHTLYAYHRALVNGAHALEVDVVLSSDGVLVVHHDQTVNRVTNGSGSIQDMTLAELRALDNAYWFAPDCEGVCRNEPNEAYVFRGVATGQTPPPAGFDADDFKIVTMREVLETFPGVLMSIEIKGEAPDSVPGAEALADLLGEFGRSTDVLVASFDDDTIAAFKARNPDVNTTPGLLEVTAWVANPQPLPDHVALQVPRTFSGILVVTEQRVLDAHANGLAVYVFIDPGEETTAIYDELVDAGVDGIITDYPSNLRARLDERGVAYPDAPIPTLPDWARVALWAVFMGGGALATRFRAHRVHT